MKTLFGEQPDMPARKRKPKLENSESVLEIERVYIAEHERKWSVPPRNSEIGFRRRVFDQLERDWGKDEVVRILMIYFSTTDPKIVAGDYGIRDFNRYAQYLRQREHRPQAHQRTIENADAAARATGRRR